MSGLPQGWASASVGELIELNPKNESDDDAIVGFVPMPLIATNFLDQVRYEEKPWRDVKKGYTHFADGDVLLAKITPCFENGKAGIPTDLPNGIGAGSTEYFVCRPKGGLLTAKYLLAYFKTRDFLLDGETNMTGSVGHKRVPKDFLLEREIPVSPLPEQTRIADKLDALLARVDAIRARLDTIPALLKRFRQSVLAAATSGALTEEWRGGGEAEWEDATIGDVCESSFYGPRFGKDEYTRSENGIPTVRTTDMTDDGRIEITDDTPRVAVPADKIEKFAAKAGDLLVTRTGSIGVMAVFDGSFVAIPSAYLIRFRFKETVLPRYAFYCLMAPAGQSAMGLSTTAITQPNINAESIKAISISLPPIDEQAEIVRRVESLFAIADRVQAQYTTARARVDRLTPALLAKAFRGELVPQDPSDEPASALLQRLRAGKASAAAPAKRGRKPSTAAAKARKPR